MIYHLLALVSLFSPVPPGVGRIASGVRYGNERRHLLDIYAPAGRSGPLPVIYFLYGGSWSMGARGYYAFAARALSAAGFVVVVADYRLVPRVEYPRFLDDCALALEWTIGNIGTYGGDQQRIAVLGHSAGAYNAIMTILRSRVSGDNIRAMAGLSGPYDFYPFDGPISLRVFGAVGEPKATQPINLVREGLPPAFLAHGDLDDLVMPRNTVALAERLRIAGNVVVEKHYAGVTHPGTLLQLGAWGRRGAVYDDLVAFLTAHV